MPSDSDRRGLMHEIEHRRIKREVELALQRTARLREAVQEIQELYRDKSRGRPDGG